MSLVGAVLTGLLLLGVGVWLTRRSGAPPPASPDDIDRDELDAAEREVRDLDVLASPEEADDALPDWGPGVGHRRDGRTE